MIGDWREYLGALGIALPLYFLALFNKKNSKNILFLLLVAWAYAPIFGFLLAKKMTILSPFRFFQAQQSIPLGILSAMGIFWLWERWKSKLILFLLGIIIVATSIPYYSLTIAEQMKKSNATYNIFLPNDTLAAFQYLDKNSQNEAVVMAGFYTSWMLPAFSHNRVFAAHGDRTYEYEKKLDLLRIFYSGKPTIAEVKQLLEKYNISFILFTPDTPPPTDHIINKLPNIKLIYKRGNNYIYQRSWNL